MIHILNLHKVCFKKNFYQGHPAALDYRKFKKKGSSSAKVSFITYKDKATLIETCYYEMDFNIYDRTNVSFTEGKKKVMMWQ